MGAEVRTEMGGERVGTEGRVEAQLSNSTPEPLPKGGRIALRLPDMACWLLDSPLFPIRCGVRNAKWKKQAVCFRASIGGGFGRERKSCDRNPSSANMGCSPDCASMACCINSSWSQRVDSFRANLTAIWLSKVGQHNPSTAAAGAGIYGNQKHQQSGIQPDLHIRQRAGSLHWRGIRMVCG